MKLTIRHSLSLQTTLSVLVCLIVLACSRGQRQADRLPSVTDPISREALSADHFFPKDKLMLFGSYYYPEQWDSSQWSRDLKQMATMGFDFTHFAEFAWGMIEPEEGKYDFAWLDQAVELAAQHGLKIVMCTPTPTPPAWLTAKHPDILMVNDMGITIQHGARQQASWSSDTYRHYVRGIVEVLARRYGNNPAIIGWQIDNEPSHYGQDDYSPNAQTKFRQWLEAKYHHIDTLNNSWGNAFWSQRYNNFGQIRIPNRRELVATPNPHAVLDFNRFCADEAASFVNEQGEVLRHIIQAKQWITTNAMPYHLPVDPNRMDKLDFQTYTQYLVHGADEGIGEQGFRLASPHRLAFYNDTYRNYPGGIYGVMELQPGQVNWGAFNPQPYPGAMRLWAYHVFAGGSKLLCHYRFRQPLKGSEQYHYGMMQTDGVTPAVGGREYMQMIEEMKTLNAHRDANPQMPEALAKRKTAILYNIDNEFEMNFQAQTNQWNTREHILRYYKALKSFGAPVDIIHEQNDFSAYPVLIAPAYELLDEGLIDRWKQYAQHGGHLVLTCRTGQKDREAHLWEAKFASPIYDLIGASDLYFDHLPANRQATVQMANQHYTWNTWGDIVTPTAAANVWATYADQFYKGKAAVLHRQLGKGTVTYVAVDTDDGRLEKDVLRWLYQQTGISILDLPTGVTIEWRDGLFIGLNYSSDRQVVPVPKEAQILIGSANLAPAEVVVWK